MTFISRAVILTAAVMFSSCQICADKIEQPRIVNIVNFIRAIEPRDEQRITRDVLRATVESQIDQLNAHGLPATFLLQYDALIDPAYAELLKSKLSSQSEIGGWWEITEPHVLAAGIAWRGRYPWDWHADVGFATGYSPAERERLVDVYMAKFHEIFGRYPASVGSWFIDAHTLGYMHDRYGLIASCNCKDQYGTDGYTLWGGYWNQAYYPSRLNAYMPAQDAQSQINVPIFRMLGSDPIHQYDNGIGTSIQGVTTLEPVYPDAGGSRRWTEWFFGAMFNEPCLAFNYVQAGQENSFTWDAMKSGLSFQIPMLDSLSRAGKIRVETLEQSGVWFRKNFELTPPTAVTSLSDYRSDRKTVWYNSRFYRANLLWEGGRFRFRDVHLFDQRFESDYLRRAGESNQCVYTTLPLVDGYLWSTPDSIAGLRIMVRNESGDLSELSLGAPVVEEQDASTLRIKTSSDVAKFEIIFAEGSFTIQGGKGLDWLAELQVAPGRELPIVGVANSSIMGNQRGYNYAVSCTEGVFEATNEVTRPFRITPQDGRIVVDCEVNK